MTLFLIRLESGHARVSVSDEALSPRAFGWSVPAVTAEMEHLRDQAPSIFEASSDLFLCTNNLTLMAARI